MGIPGDSVVKNLPVNSGNARCGFESGRQADPLGKDVAPHSSILAWKIQWTEEPGGLQSLGSQRFRHDLATELACMFSNCGATEDS